MPDDRVTRTLDALVDEAYRIALDRGIAITNPDSWRRWKRAVYADTARREGPGYLRHHHQRLGLGTTTSTIIRCDNCDNPVITPTHHDNDTTHTYCSYACAGIPTMTYAEYLATLTPEQRTNMERLRRHQEGAA